MNLNEYAQFLKHWTVQAEAKKCKCHIYEPDKIREEKVVRTVMERKECKVVDERLMSVMDNSSVKAIFILTCAHCDAFILKCWTSYKNEQL